MMSPHTPASAKIRVVTLNAHPPRDQSWPSWVDESSKLLPKKEGRLDGRPSVSPKCGLLLAFNGDANGGVCRHGYAGGHAVTYEVERERLRRYLAIGAVEQVERRGGVAVP